MEQQLIQVLEQTQSSQEEPRKQAEQHLQVKPEVTNWLATTDAVRRTSIIIQTTH